MKDKKFFVVFFFQSNFNNLLKTVIRVKGKISIYQKGEIITQKKKNRQNLKKKGKCSRPNFERKAFISYLR